MTLEEVAGRFPGGKWQQGHYKLLCPCHADSKASLDIWQGENGGIQIKCYGGCDKEALLASAGLSFRDLAPPGAKPNGAGSLDRFGGQPITEWYRYDNEDGTPRYLVGRTANKDFPVCLPGADHWHKSTEGEIQWCLFGLPELLATEPGAVVAICEGEKDVLRVRKRGLPATCNPGGASRSRERPKWRPQYTEWLKQHLPDCRFAIFPDQDEAGLMHAEAIDESLKAAGLPVFVVEMPGLKAKEDVSDWLARHTDEEFQALLKPRVRFPLLTVEEMLDLPPPVWQVESLWERGGVVMIFGEGSSGKTFLTVDICMHLIRDLEWSGHPVEAGPIVYINADGGIPFRQRPQAWMFENPGLPARFPFLIFNDRIDMRDGARFAEFVAELKEHPQPPAALIIDTFHRCMPGADENNAQDTSLFFDSLGIARRELGATTVFLHHSNRADTGHRGHSSLRDDSDTAIEVREESGGLRRVRCDKQRNGVEFADFFFDLRPVLDSCVIEMSAPPEEDEEEGVSRRRKPPREEAQIQAALREIITAGQMTQAELASRLERSQPRISTYCRTLRQRGLITIRQGLIDSNGRRPDIYEPRPELRRDE